MSMQEQRNKANIQDDRSSSKRRQMSMHEAEEQQNKAKHIQTVQTTSARSSKVQQNVVQQVV